MNGLAARDSIHQMRDSIQAHDFAISLDSSYIKSIRASNEALAKYNLILIDSLGTVSQKINIKSINKPQLAVAAAIQGAAPPIYISKEEENTFMNIQFLSEGNASYNIKIYYYMFGCNSSDKAINTVLDSGILINNRKSFPTNRWFTTKILIRPESLKQECYFILMLGSYSSDRQNLDIIKYEDAFTYDFKNQKVTIASGGILNTIKTKLKLKGGCKINCVKVSKIFRNFKNTQFIWKSSNPALIMKP